MSGCSCCWLISQFPLVFITLEAQKACWGELTLDPDWLNSLIVWTAPVRYNVMTSQPINAIGTEPQHNPLNQEVGLLPHLTPVSWGQVRLWSCCDFSPQLIGRSGADFPATGWWFHAEICDSQRFAGGGAEATSSTNPVSDPGRLSDA